LPQFVSFSNTNEYNNEQIGYKFYTFDQFVSVQTSFEFYNNFNITLYANKM